MAPEQTKVVPLTCHGHSRPITHLSFSAVTDGDQYYLITACKDNNPILRDGITGDWIGTFIGHKGAVWSARLSADAKLAATGSADFSAYVNEALTTVKIWDTHTGQNLHTLQHSHIVRAVAFPPGQAPRIVATGGAEKKLRIWAIFSRPSASNGTTPTNNPTPNANATSTAATITDASDPSCYEVGPGIHTGTIKSIVFTPDDPNILITAAEDKRLRWWDLRTRGLLAEYLVDGNIGSCELTALNNTPITNGASSATASTHREPILAIAASKSVYFFSGSAARPAMLLRSFTFTQDMSCVALSPAPSVPAAATEAVARQFVTGSPSDTWVHLFPFASDDASAGDAAPAELEVGKGHHGPVWSAAYSPDGRLYATGSEDGTVKLWKVGGSGTGGYGLWR